MIKAGVMAVVLGATLAGCAGLPEYSQGPLQPQAVSGPCRVKPFFLLAFISVPAELEIENTGETCTMLLINPALNRPINAALMTGQARYGRARAGLTSGARQAVVFYTPQPGYAGADTFSVTLQPNAVGITFRVTVAPSPPRPGLTGAPPRS